MDGDRSVIDSAIQTILGQTWLEGRLRYNYLSPNKKVAETIAYHENGQMRFVIRSRMTKCMGLAGSGMSMAFYNVRKLMSIIPCMALRKNGILTDNSKKRLIIKMVG